jgi:hypothetical protein
VLKYFTFETILAVHCVQTHSFQLEEADIFHFCEQVHERLCSRISDPFSWMFLPLQHVLGRLPVEKVAPTLLHIALDIVAQHRTRQELGWLMHQWFVNAAAGVLLHDESQNATHEAMMSLITEHFA